MADNSRLERVAAHGFVLTVRPDLGGSIISWRDRDGVDLLRPAAAGAEDPRDCACYPLVAFSNRIAAGRFDYDGRAVRLPANMAGCPHAIHGQGWQRPWQVSARADDMITLSFDHPAGDWPWHYRARQRFILTPTGLRLRLAVENRSDRDMPAGLGLHPFFPDPEGASLSLTVGAALRTDATLIPVGRAPDHPAVAAFAADAKLPAGLDTGFEGWRGRAEIRWPARGRGVRLRADPVFGHVVVFSPRDQGFFCVEPVSHCTDAVNLEGSAWGDTGLKRLAPGATLAGEAIFEPFVL